MTEQLLLSMDAGKIVSSFLTTFIGSFTALQILKYRMFSSGRNRWLFFAGAVACWAGVGIWCAHFVGVLSVRLSKNGQYLRLAFHHWYTPLSLLVSVVFVAISFWVATLRGKDSWLCQLSASTICTAGIIAMHYLGMLSLRGQIRYHWDYDMVVVSAMCGFVGLTLAMLIFFRWPMLWNHHYYHQSLAALLLAAGASLLHFLGLQAANMSYDATPISFDGYLSEGVMFWLVTLISIFTCLFCMAVTVFRWHQLSFLNPNASDEEHARLQAQLDAEFEAEIKAELSDDDEDEEDEEEEDNERKRRDDGIRAETLRVLTATKQDQAQSHRQFARVKYLPKANLIISDTSNDEDSSSGTDKRRPAKPPRSIELSNRSSFSSSRSSSSREPSQQASSRRSLPHYRTSSGSYNPIDTHSPSSSVRTATVRASSSSSSDESKMSKASSYSRSHEGDRSAEADDENDEDLSVFPQRT